MERIIYLERVRESQERELTPEQLLDFDAGAEVIHAAIRNPHVLGAFEMHGKSIRDILGGDVAGGDESRISLSRAVIEIEKLTDSDVVGAILASAINNLKENDHSNNDYFNGIAQEIRGYLEEFLEYYQDLEQSVLNNRLAIAAGAI